MKIKKLHIKSKNFSEQLRFFGEVLELPVRKIKETEAEIAIGYSKLILEKSSEFTPYHITFHIPPKKIEESVNWLKKRVEIQCFEEDEIIDFSSWNAKSTYFYDKDFNILEFISREKLFDEMLNQVQHDKFSSTQILGIAEIGLATDEVQSAFNFLADNFQLKKYSGDLEKFCAIGDDEGLIISINKNKKDWFPTNDKAFASLFQLQFEQAKNTYQFSFKNNILTVC
ncbi:VOC family protein [Mesonia maritima]|uniref:Catechol-2,3-dioxygenase n=1 Tax=Mesonia maritima TaxID=1793873 RepID=A0ABU1K751_9FLAO|nr:VOC family protein [Mesonia maritima]MDR6300332.1 catechol-2,3-dioxygenase [Mesonia maritima]